MSFNDEYLKLRKKRLEAEEYRRENTSPNPTVLLDTLFPKASSDIAPVRQTEQEKQMASNDERKWFQSGAFEDGYQFGDILKTGSSTIRDITQNALAGILGMGEKVVDAGAYLVGGVGGLFSEDFKDDVGDFIAKDLYDEEDVAKKILSVKDLGYTIGDKLFGEYANQDANWVDADKYSILGEKSDSLVQSGGQLLGTIGLQAVGVPWFVTSGVTSFGSEAENAFNQGATYGQAGLSAAISAGVEIATEKLFGGSGLGEKGLINLEGLTKGISNKVGKALLDFGIDMTAEGAEEVVSQIGSNFASALYSEKNLQELLFSEEAFDEYLESFIGGMALGGFANVGNVGNSIKTGRDYRTGLTESEQKVFDNVYNKRIAEAQEGGKELSKKEKDAIYDAVMRDLEKGGIDIDTIEEVLGDDVYKSYKDTIDYEDDILKQFEELGNKTNPTLAEQSLYAELKSQADGINQNSQREAIKSRLSEEVFGKVKDTKLAESYNERARRGQVFEADLSQYDEKQQEVIKRAVESGILNNTNRTHEFVDLIAKISADKGVLFDFTNNAKLKESGFAVDGKEVNGFVTKDGISINIDSHKALQSTVGHEITHVLEGTELYAEMQRALFDYAKSKGDFDGRRKSLAELYKDIEGADVNAELAADLVGDYLFTDEDFVKRLSTQNRNVFQKIYDEIKYLWKLATAGSKEARELEKVKRAFDKAYKEGGKASEGMKYSLSDSDGKQLTKGQQEYFKDSKMRDENGNLKVMYHGSQDAGFHEFNAKFSDDDTSFFFVDRNDVAASYSGTTETYEAKSFRTVEDFTKFFDEIGYNDYEVIEKDGKYALLDEGDEVATSESLAKIYEEWCDYAGLGEGQANYKVYLNLTNPLEIDAKGRPWNKIDAEFSQEVYDRYKSLTDEEKAALVDLAEWEDFRIFNSEIQEAKGNALASAYAKMGEDVNIYDLFSAAADGFSEEAIRENSRYYLKTRDYAQRAKEQGYDGVIFKNIIDNGGYSNGDEGASTVAIAFDSNQIKSVANEKPTSDADIRYSLTEYTAEEKKAHNDAVLEHFGKTYKWAETGYLLLDGSKLDLSGKHDGAPGGYRTVDHRDITEALGYDYGGGDYSGSLVQFMSEGNIRIVPEMNGINLSVKPTKAQEQALSDYISRARGEVVLDIDDLNGYTVVSVEYPRGTYYAKVLNDIREWFDNGKQPETSGLSAFRSLTKKGEPQKRYGNYNIYGKDVRYEAPMQEDISKTETTTPTVSKTETVENVAPEGFAPIPEEEVNAMQSESLAHLDDADAPPEMEAPYYGETQDAAPIDPFEDRNMKEVSRDRKTPAYMYENPEVKPFFQAEANILLGELERVEKPETIYNGWAKYEMSYEAAQDIPEIYRTERIASDTIVYLRDTIGMSYADIEKGLKAIIEDHGAENIAAAKKLEFVINDRLLYGYHDDGGFEIPANQDYINLLTEKEIREYIEEARKQFFDVADSYAPQEDDIAPVAATTEEISEVPVKEQYEAIKPERKKSTEPRLKRVTDADAIAPTESKTAEIYDTEPETGKKKSRGWARFRANFLDKQSVFEDLALKTNNRELMGKANYILSAERRAQRLIGKGKQDAGVKSLNDIRAEVESTCKTKQFYEYLYHKHNIDRMSLDESKPVFGDTVTADVSRAEVAKYEAANPEFTEHAKDVYDYMNYLRDQMVESGVISQETADLWAQMYPHYVPIRRLGDTGLNINVPLDTGRTGVNAPIKRATGGSRDILPLFDTMALRTEQTYKAIAKNNFGVELKNTLGSTIERAETNLDEMIDSVDAHEELLKKGENGRNPTFTVFEDGKKVTFEITEDMYDALKPTSDDLRYTNKVANTISNVHRGILTEYNPTFMLTNAIKDAQDILINSQHPAKTYANMPNAITQMATNGKWYQEYLENGGESNTYFDGQSNTFTKDDTGIKKIVGMPLRAISAVNNYVEMAPRLAEYIASRKAGASAEVAMLDAARVTTNFAAGGDVTKFANRNGFTFLNASVQGAMQQVRNVREAKANGLKGWVQLATKVALAGIPAMILNNLLWDDDEEYEQLSDYVKDNYYVVAKFGDGQFVRIPKGRALAVIQDALEQVGNALTGNDEVDLANFLELAISNLAPNNPLDNNILAPIGQVLSNKTWYGDDLVPTRLQDLPAAEQFDESTDSISKWLGEKMNVSPYKLNYLLNQYSGGVGDVVLPMLTPEAESGDNSLAGNLIAPMRDKFTTDSVMNNQNVSNFYETVDKLTANAKSSYATDEDILKYKYMNSVNSELGELYKQKREIQNSDLADAKKYEAVRDIQKQIDALAEESLNTYGNVNIDGGYAVVGDRYYKLNDNGEWVKITDKQLEKQEDVTSGLGIDPATYWENKSEYDFAYEYPEKYAVAKSVGGYEKYKTYQSEMYDIKADKDEDGKSIVGSRKDKVADYINGLDISYEEKIILFKSEYNADDTYNYEIIDYLNNRNDISYDEMVSILKELGFTVKGDTITWD